MKKNKCMFYVCSLAIFVIGILFALYFLKSTNAFFESKFLKTGSIGIWRPYLVKLVAFAFIGVLLRLFNLYNEIISVGKWKYDFVKVCIIGIPILFFSLASPLYWLLGIQNSELFAELFNSSLFMEICNVAFGFVLASGFYKKIS